jgi:hypothetical protein
MTGTSENSGMPEKPPRESMRRERPGATGPSVRLTSVCHSGGRSVTGEATRIVVSGRKLGILTAIVSLLMITTGLSVFTSAEAGAAISKWGAPTEIPGSPGGLGPWRA